MCRLLDMLDDLPLLSGLELRLLLSFDSNFHRLVYYLPEHLPEPSTPMLADEQDTAGFSGFSGRQLDGDGGDLRPGSVPVLVPEACTDYPRAREVADE